MSFGAGLYEGPILFETRNKANLSDNPRGPKPQSLLAVHNKKSNRIREMIGNCSYASYKNIKPCRIVDISLKPSRDPCYYDFFRPLYQEPLHSLIPDSACFTADS